jgi:hypothetical protein
MMPLSPPPRWVLPLVVLADLVALAVLYALLGRPALLFGLPLLVGTVVVVVVLRLTTPTRRLPADLHRTDIAGAVSWSGPYRHGSPGNADDPLWWWPTDHPTSSWDDTCVEPPPWCPLPRRVVVLGARPVGPRV